MNKTFWSILGLFVVVGAFIIFQATNTKAALVLYPSELAKKGAPEIIERVRVGGRVAALPISYEIEPKAKLSFSIHDPTHSEPNVQVIYHGLKPDMFAPGRDVIIDGEFSGGVLHAKTLLTQCPSKYEPPSPG
ncbi:MAG: cytochrome c maturation protein CcmE [Bdellovibrionales bacterium]|nr:cytochrome c maturation protein CcmE [Bdellovibrionales bacterium]